MRGVADVVLTQVAFNLSGNPFRALIRPKALTIFLCLKAAFDLWPWGEADRNVDGWGDTEANPTQ